MATTGYQEKHINSKKLARCMTNSGPFSQINTQKSLNCVNHTPTLKVLHQQMLINELDLTITSTFLAGRISHYAHN